MIIDEIYCEAIRIEYEEKQKALVDSQYVKISRNAGNKNITNNEYYDEEIDNDDSHSLLGAIAMRKPKKGNA